MADTLRQTILSKIGEVLEGVSGVEKVEIERSTPVDIDTIPFATCFVYSGPEERATDDRSTIGFETFDWTVVIEVWEGTMIVRHYLEPFIRLCLTIIRLAVML